LPSVKEINMNKKIAIRPFNVIDNKELPEMIVEQLPTDGDPLEINREMYYVCENLKVKQSDHQRIGVIPLVVRNPMNVSNIEEYIHCLSLAHRKVQFKNDKGNCDLENCDEMIIS
jgi:hypothetical protein